AAETQLTQSGWNSVRWSPDSTRLVMLKPGFTSAPVDGPVAVVNVGDGAVQTIPQVGVEAIWSPDGEYLLVASIDRRMWLYSFKDNQVALISGASGWPVAWLTDGRLIYGTDLGLQSARLSLPAAGEAPGRVSVTEPVSLVAFDGSAGNRWASPSPTLDTIVLYDGSNDSDRKWWLVQPDGAQVDLEKPFYSIGACCAWSKDGRRFGFFSKGVELSIYVVDPDGANLKQVLPAGAIGDGTFISMDFSPDGQTIAFEWSARDEHFPFANTQIYLVNTDGSGLLNFTPDSAPHRWLRWSPDGQYIAYLGAQDTVWVAQVDTSP
ncbi:MAG: hypothetical protein ABI847_16405, partial [Anaerolineales bacterium]